MKLVILHTILMQLWVGVVWGEATHVMIEVRDAKTQLSKFVEVTREQAEQIISRRNQLRSARDFYIDPLLSKPITPEKLAIAKKIADRAVQPVRSEAEAEQARQFFEDATRPLLAKGESSEKVKTFVENLVAISQESEELKPYLGEKTANLEDIVKLTREAEETKKIQDQAEALKAESDASKKESDAAAKKQAEQEKTKQQEQAFQKQLEQQALAQALNQANEKENGRGASGGNSGGNNNSSSNKTPELPKSETPKINQDNFSDQLAKVINQKNNTPDFNSLFNNNSSSSSNSSKEKKDDGFKFDISPKTPKTDKVEPVKASVPQADPSNPLNPTAAQLPEGALENFLSGPSSVPQLMAASVSDTFNPAFNGNSGGNPTGGNPPNGAGGFGGGINGGMPTGAGMGNASEIFSSVGQIEYGDRPPPIRKDSAAYGGEGGAGAGEGGSEALNNSGGSNQKKLANSLLDELTLMSNNPRAKGRGIMAFVGFQVKDFCTKSGARKMAICSVKKRERVSLVAP